MRNSPANEKDLHFMQRALELAAQAAEATLPNPMVGAVVVRDGVIVGEGWHRKAGMPHAEAEALREAGSAASGAALYVTLEPCNHYGRTPPCCEAIIAAGVARVVIASLDPNDSVCGGGAERLRQAGIEVTTGICSEEEKRLNHLWLAKLEKKGSEKTNV